MVHDADGAGHLPAETRALNATLASAVFAPDGRILRANNRFLRSFGYGPAEIVGRSHADLCHPDDRASGEVDRLWAAVSGGAGCTMSCRRMRADATAIWLRASYTPLAGPDGVVEEIVLLAADITGAQHEETADRVPIAAINASQAVIHFSLAGTILDVDPLFLSLTGCARGEVVGRHHRMLLDPSGSGSAADQAFWARLAQGEPPAGEVRLLAKDGREIRLQATYTPVRDPAGPPVKLIACATDVTADAAMAAAFEDARRQARHDAATALPNRVRLAGFLAAMLASSTARLAVLSLDLDRFKPINDTYGHLVGDRVLGEIADRLRRMLRPDQFVARVGGDEFVVAAPDLTDHEIAHFCQHILALVAQPVLCEAGEIRIGVSIGVAVSPLDGTTPDDLLRSADTALLRVKQHRRGSYGFFSPEISDQLMAQRALADDIRRGLAAGEFFVEYQPRFDTRERTIRSVEALVRWSHPQRGRISPAEFIPVAERCGLIGALGGWVLRTACAAAAAWPGIGVSVNVSPIQFRDDGLLGVVAEALAAAGLAPERLEIEITEGVLLEDAERARRLLDGLKELGVRLAMDDFGTGYSSLIYLHNFPFDVIKIDRQFVADIEHRQSGRAVVQAILSLGRALGLSVTAEGVETIGQLAALTIDQCSEVQGFLLAKPMPGGHIAALLAQAGAAPDGGEATRGDEPPVRAA